MLLGRRLYLPSMGLHESRSCPGLWHQWRKLSRPPTRASDGGFNGSYHPTIHGTSVTTFGRFAPDTVTVSEVPPAAVHDRPFRGSVISSSTSPPPRALRCLAHPPGCGIVSGLLHIANRIELIAVCREWFAPTLSSHIRDSAAPARSRSHRCAVAPAPRAPAILMPWWRVCPDYPGLLLRPL